MTSKTNPTPGPLTDDTESWKRTLSILAGIKQVAGEVRAEARQIEAAYPDQWIKPGHWERADLVSALNNAYAVMSADVRAIARSRNIAVPESLR
ncbi:hypothetical protein [Ruegeria sp. THAF33]|uniref:hypothetical protein n=1 Tax=Ruegeria sp. THAF33 TaxID=2587853 RepID=UPI00126922F1|nr:hypothetical protein [Ruegeria sp. THAF33]QFT72178.1 hypothetical protein FIU92_03995 [Ruegeria sp. THAF33]